MTNHPSSFCPFHFISWNGVRTQAHQKQCSSCRQARSGVVVLKASHSKALATPKAATCRGSNAGRSCKTVIMAGQIYYFNNNNNKSNSALVTAHRLTQLKPRTHDRKTASQTQLAASVTQKPACLSGPSYVGASPVSPKLQSLATQSHTSNDHARMSTDRSSTLEWTLELT